MNIIPNSFDELKKILQILINEEFDSFILDLKNKNPNEKFYKNGTYTITFNSELGSMKLNIPRIRGHKFKSSLLTSKSYSNKIVTMCVELYGQGLSTHRISNVLLKTFDIGISKSQISTFCESLNENVENYFNTKINKEFVTISIDAKYFSVRDISKKKSPLVSAIGTTADGEKYNIHMKVIRRENKTEFLSFLEELKVRLVKLDPIFIIDGIESMPSAIHEVFGEVPIQRCLVHVVRSVKKVLHKFASISEIKEIETKLNDIYFRTDNANIENRIVGLLEEYPKYINTIKRIINNKNIYTFLQYEGGFSNYIKTNNQIEQFHSNLEAVSKQHRTYPDEKSLYRAIISEVERFNELSNDIESFDDVKNTNVIFNIDIFKKLKQLRYCKIRLVNSGRIIYDGEISNEKFETIKLVL